jgi:tetratricopeptide (TPR) repeat protein
MKKHRCLIFLFNLFSLCCFCSLSTVSQGTDELIRQGNLLEKQMKEEDAYLKFKEIVKLQPHHLFALTRCSELASRIGKRQQTKSKQMDYYEAAKIYAERALKVNPNDSEANVVMSVAYGRLALVKDGKEKVGSVREIKIFASRALQLNPSNFKALHVLGKWHYEVSNLSSIERGAAKLLFGGLPKASGDSAIYYYEKAKALSPVFILNYLELAKAYYANKKKDKAIEYLKYLLKLPNTTSEDEMIKAEAKELIKKWN